MTDAKRLWFWSFPRGEIFTERHDRELAERVAWTKDNKTGTCAEGSVVTMGDRLSPYCWNCGHGCTPGSGPCGMCKADERVIVLDKLIAEYRERVQRMPEQAGPNGPNYWDGFTDREHGMP